MKRRKRPKQPSQSSKRPSSAKDKPFFRPFADAKAHIQPPEEPAAQAPKPPEPVAEAEAALEREPESFRDMMADVRPINRGNLHHPVLDEVPHRERDRQWAARQAEDDEQVREHLRRLVSPEHAGAAGFEVTDDGGCLEGRRQDTDLRLFRSLRRGELPVDATLDLHGMRAEDARRKLELFLSQRRGLLDRAVLVIHGKGRHSAGGFGVLRGEIGAWLSQGPERHSVEAFATAQPEHGGFGALYVLLRRLR